MYTVGEWIGDTDDAYVVAEMVSLDTANTFLDIAPPHLKRFITNAEGYIIRDQRGE